MGVDYRQRLFSDVFPLMLGAPAWEEQQAMTAPCKNCERRTIHPNCHATCEEYKRFSQERRTISARRLDESMKMDVYFDKVNRLTKGRK